MKILRNLNPLQHVGRGKKRSWIQSQLAVILLCFCYIFLTKLGFTNQDTIRAYMIVTLLITTGYAAFRSGLLRSLIGACVSSVYIAYIFSNSHQPFRFTSDNLQIVLLVNGVFFITALFIGWIRDQLDELVQKEVSARQLAEEGQLRLERILEQLPVGVLLADETGKIVGGNKRLETMFGKKLQYSLRLEDSYLSQGAFRGGNALTPKEWPIVRALETGKIVSGQEIEFLRWDKKRLYLRVHAAPIKNRKKKIVAAVSTIYDATQEKELEKRKDDFISIASHELKTPITSIKLYIDVLLQRLQAGKDMQSTRILLQVREQTERLRTLVTELLDVSKIRTGRLQFQKEVFHLDDFVEDTIAGLQGVSLWHKLVFTKRVPVVVFADRYRIYQVLTNLITNATKYAPKKSEIHIAVKKKNEKALVSVKDFGIGIPAEEHKKVFERLYQVASADEKAYPGLGLGLYIVKEIVKRHRGSIWVKSEIGKGAEFFFTLPLARKVYTKNTHEQNSTYR
ncbi:MAG TPA: ATP-binding protein [Patescibacteria group bacterium]|nr:ATP-binding protein [Patescibacteria group bacterium]